MSTKRLRVLVVEDEAMLAFGLERDLHEAGYGTVGPFRNLDAARRGALDESFEIAILDINLNGEFVYPVADQLARCGTPFCFLTGYGEESIPVRFRDIPRLSKPHDPAHLRSVLERLARQLVQPAPQRRHTKPTGRAASSEQN